MSSAGALLAVLLLAPFVLDARAQSEPDAGAAAPVTAPAEAVPLSGPVSPSASAAETAGGGGETLGSPESAGSTAPAEGSTEADLSVRPPPDGDPPQADEVSSGNGAAPVDGLAQGVSGEASTGPEPGEGALVGETPSVAPEVVEGRRALSEPSHPVAGAGADAAPGTTTAAPSDLTPTPGEQVLYDRLLGQDQGGTVASEGGSPAVGLEVAPPAIPTWLWVVGVLGGVGLLLLRSRTVRGLRGPKAIDVLTRTALGKDGSLAVVEVAEADGEKRRLLVGFGGGAPRLVADLGRRFPEDVAGSDVAATVDALRVRADASGPRAAAGRPGAVNSSRSNATSAWARAVREADGSVLPPQTGGARLERRHDLIQEVLAERGDDEPHEVNG